MNKPTPGPWTISPDGVPKGWKQISIYAEDGDGRTLATVRTSEADANLIAASPDMFEALRMMLSEVEADDQALLPEAIIAARAAIAKAHGHE